MLILPPSKQPEDGELELMTSSDLSDPPGAPGWTELAVALSQIGRSVVLLALDESERGQRLASVVEESFAELDAASGRHLAVVAPVRPPDGWFGRKLAELSSLPPEIQSAHRDELHRMRTDAGIAAAQSNLADLVQSNWQDTRPPSLVFVAEASDDDPAAPALDAWAYDLAGFEKRGRIVACIRHLGGLAKQRAASGRLGSADLHDDAFDWSAPKSLAWRSAAYRTLGVVELFADAVRRIGAVKSALKA